MLGSSISGGMVYDTQKKVDDFADGLSSDPSDPSESPTNFTFFNCTNCYELQTTTPTPKPTFELVTVQLTRKQSSFDGESLADGTQYSYKQWNFYEPLDASDLQQKIVQVNPAYLGAVYALAPSESMLFTGLANVVLSL
eukprot:3982719-Prymnesium_polylepis.2